MGYVSISLRQQDLLLDQGGGIFVKGGREVLPGNVFVTLHEEDYRNGVFLVGLRVYGELLPYTWTDGNIDYRASSFPTVDDEEPIVGVTQIGGTRQQFEHHRRNHAAFCKARGWTQGQFVHLPGQPKPDL